MFHKEIDNRTIIFEFIDRGYYDENHLAYIRKKRPSKFNGTEALVGKNLVTYLKSCQMCYTNNRKGAKLGKTSSTLVPYCVWNDYRQTAN